MDTRQKVLNMEEALGPIDATHDRKHDLYTARKELLKQGGFFGPKIHKVDDLSITRQEELLHEEELRIISSIR